MAKLTIKEIESIIENAICDDAGVTVESVEPYDGDYCTVILNGDVEFSILRAIAKAVHKDPIVGAEEYNKLSLFFNIPDKDELSNGDDDDDDDDEQKENKKPAIPDYMRHKDKFYDSEDIVIPGTEMNCSNTEQCEKIKAWIKETGHYPIVYVRLDDGLHVEVSNIYDQKVKDVLERGEVVGFDARKYKIDNPDNLLAIGSSICVRATCIETGRNDAYDLDFFV